MSTEAKTPLSQPLALIQLVSEQTMQNLLPVLRLEPDKLVHLVTPKTAARSSWIANAAKQRGIKPKVETIHLRAMPEMRETYNAVKDAILATRETGFAPIVNFTGGTKLMSIGAYAAALNHEHRAISLYVDTQDELFIDGRTAEGLIDLLDGDSSFTPLRKSLNVNVIAVANGRERVTDGEVWKPFIPLAQHMLEHPDEEKEVHDAIHGGPSNPGKAFLRGDQFPHTPAPWLELLDRDLVLPPAVLELALRAGLVRPSQAGKCRLPESKRDELQTLADAQSRKQYLPDYRERYFAASEIPSRSLRLLDGGWWEIVVAEAAEQSHLFRDLRWSAVAGERQGASLEEDILGIDGVQILCISCKRGGPRQKLTTELEQLNNRAFSIGGHFTRRILAIYVEPRGAFKKALYQRAQAMNIRILGPSDLANPEAFARAQRTL